MLSQRCLVASKLLFRMGLRLAGVLFLVSTYLLLPINATNEQSTICQNSSHLIPRVEVFKRQVLTRRKRVVVFPTKAFVLITQSFTKAIIDGRPPGIAYSIEFDMYSTLPDTLEAWQPTILKNKLKSEKKAEGPTEKKKDNQSDTMKESKIPPDTINAEENWSPPTSVEEHDDLPVLEEDWSTEDEYPSPRYDPFPYKQKQRIEQEKEMENFYKKFYWKPKYTEPNSFPTEDTNHWPPIEEVYESEADVPVWKYHRAYRERREIFEQLETFGKIFNFDMKACIQRGMCEMRSKLKPYGESLMEDIVSIILTIPKKLNFNDDYSFDFSQHEQESPPNCGKHFKDTCPYGVLDFLTNTLRTVRLEDQHGDNNGSDGGIFKKNLK